jgi:predicted transcriptional regulator
MVINTTAEERAEMNRLRASGMTLDKIAEWIGCSRAVVSYHTRKEFRGSRRVSVRELKIILEMKANGATADAICKRTLLSKRTVDFYTRTPGVVSRVDPLRAAEMRERGMTFQAIAEEFGVGRGAVFVKLKRHLAAQGARH